MKFLRLHFQRSIKWIILVLVLSFFFLAAPEEFYFHGDESQWIATSIYLEAAVDPSFSPPAWLSKAHITTNGRDAELAARFPSWAIGGLGDLQPPNQPWDTNYWTLTQPPMVRYIIGISRWINGYSADEVNTPWDFDANRNYNYRQGTIPSDALLFSTRRTMAILSIFSGIMLFIVVQHSAGVVAAWCSTILYSSSLYLLTHLSHAMGDASLLFFTCLAMLTGLLALRAWDEIRKSSWQKATLRQRILPFVWLACMGIAAGMAGSAKLNGLGIALGGVALSWAMAFARQGLTSWRSRFALALVGSVLVSGMCVTTFVGLNPYLYPNPIARTAAMFTLRTWEMERNMHDERWGMPTLSERLKTVSERVLETYTFLHFAVINVPLGCAGLAFLLWGSWKWLANRNGQPGGPVLLTVGCVTVLPALTTPIDWDRYYLYPVLFLLVFIAIGMAQGILYVYRKTQEEPNIQTTIREF